MVVWVEEDKRVSAIKHVSCLLADEAGNAKQARCGAELVALKQLCAVVSAMGVDHVVDGEEEAVNDSPDIYRRAQEVGLAVVEGKS